MLTITAADTATPEAFRTAGAKLYAEAKRLATAEAETSDDPRLAGLDPRDVVSELTQRLFRYRQGGAMLVDPRVFAALDDDDDLLIAADDEDDVQPILTDDRREPGPDLDELAASQATQLHTGDAQRTDDPAERETEGDDDDELGEDPDAETIDPSNRDQFPNIGALESYMDANQIDRTGLSTRGELETAITAHHTTTPAGEAG